MKKKKKKVLGVNKPRRLFRAIGWFWFRSNGIKTTAARSKSVRDAWRGSPPLLYIYMYMYTQNAAILFSWWARGARHCCEAKVDAPEESSSFLMMDFFKSLGRCFCVGDRFLDGLFFHKVTFYWEWKIFVKIYIFC